VRPSPPDSGFTLLETLVSLALISTVAAALGPFLIGGLRTAGVQRDRQTAVHLADDAMERVWALGRSGLLEGRSRAAVQGQWAQAPADIRAAYAHAMLCDWDPKLSAETPAACDVSAAIDTTAPGAAAPLPTVPVSTTVAGVRYQQNWYVGRCWQPATANARCTDTQGAQDLLYVRVVVAVTWPHRSCPGGLCVYQSTTLVSPSSDPVFNLW
jgi:prepilin-type N-terminal cleavage/methylation domain-containing protein